jgi:hypothetical protein
MQSLEKMNEKENEMAQAVDRNRLMEHNRIISQWERLSGSIDELEAFHYIQGILDGYGYQTKLQQVEALISLPKKAQLKINALGEIECITHSMGAGVNQLKGEIVYCNLGRPEDYKQIDARNKIALVEGIAMPGKVKAGEEAGAIAQIHISGDFLHEMCISTVWGSPDPELALSIARTPSITIRSSDGDRIKELLPHSSVQAEITTMVDTSYRKIPILEADLLGSIESDLFVLFSAHVDSWYYGAMDNGAANAAQLEVARLLAQYQPHRRGIRLAFWSGHSHGRYAGSAWYADHHWEELNDHCIAHVNIDSVGGKGANTLTHACAMQELRPLAKAVIAQLAGQDFHGSRVGRAGDHSFMGIGIPAMFMDLSTQPYPEVETATSRAFALLSGSKESGGLGWWWHTPADTIDKIDPEFLTRDTQIYLIVLNRLINSPLLPMDFRMTVQEIQAELSRYREKANDQFDLLSRALGRIKQLQEDLKTFYKLMDEFLDKGKELPYHRINLDLLHLSRILTRINYTEAGQFDQDPAYGLPPVPLLRRMNELANLEKGNALYQQTITFLVRRQNALCYALRQASDIVRELTASLLQELEKGKP